MELMGELARSAPGKKSFCVYLVGGGTAVLQGWREATIDADLYADHEEIFHRIQQIKEQLQLNVELVRPEDFVPALAGTSERHVFIKTVGRVDYFHYDPYAQVFSKLVRGFRLDLLDAERFLQSGMVDADRFRTLVDEIPEAAYARYPAISQQAVAAAVDDFFAKQSSNYP